MDSAPLTPMCDPSCGAAQAEYPELLPYFVDYRCGVAMVEPFVIEPYDEPADLTFPVQYDRVGSSFSRTNLPGARPQF